MSKGTVPITGTITTTNELDTYPTHWDKYAKGGYRSVARVTDRDAITTERRTQGMQVYIRETRQLQQLVNGLDNTKWVTLLTIDDNNKIIVNNDLNLQRYIIEGEAVPEMLPNATALSNKDDGFLMTKLGEISTTVFINANNITLNKGNLLIGADSNTAIETKTLNISNLPGDFTNSGIVSYDSENKSLVITTFIDPSNITLSKGKLLIGDDSNKAVETQSLKISNLPGDFTSDGIVKYDSTSDKLAIATPDTDYATVVTLNKIAALAQKSADDASSSSSKAEAAAIEATASATLSGTYATAADGYAKAAGESATAAGTSVLAAVAAAANATDAESKANDYASTATAASKVAGERMDAAAASATSAQNSLNTLLATGLNALPNSGDVDFKGFKGINVAPGVADTDIATVSQIAAISGNYVKTVVGTSGNISSSGGQNPVIDLVKTGVVAGGYLLSNIAVDDRGRLTAAASTTINGTANRVSVSGSGTSTMTVDLVNTAIKAGTYNLANVTFTNDGRATAATSTTISGVTGRTVVNGSGTTAMTVDLVNTGVTAGTYNNMSATIDSTGRITAATSTTPVLNIYSYPDRIITTVSGQNSTIDLATVGNAGTYNLSNTTIDKYGRVSSATNVTLNGTSGRVAVSGVGTATVTLDLVNTAVTPGAYNLSNTTIDSAGRVTAATATTISGVSGRTSVNGSGTTAMTVDLVNTGVTAGTYNNMSATIDSTGRITSATSGTGGVTNITGTANRITITGTTSPAIDIASNYVGQTSITTLGTITTGTWNGSTIAMNYGGTGSTSVPSLPNQVLVSGTLAGTSSWTSNLIDYGVGTSTSSNNLFLGSGCGKSGLTNNARNTGVGVNCFNSLSATSAVGDNVGVGSEAGKALTTGQGNAFLGSKAGLQVTIDSYNTFVGVSAGAARLNYNTCTLIGANADSSVNNLNNAIAIGYNTVVKQSNSFIAGNNCNIGIFTSTPQAKLQIGDTATAPASGASSIIYGTATTPAIALTGLEYYGGAQTSTDGLGIYLGLNRPGFRAISFSDTTYAKNGSNPMIRLSVTSTGASSAIESVSTDQSAYRPLNINATTITSSTDSVYRPSGGAWLATSDKRVKKNIKKNNRGLKEVLQLNPVNFQFNNYSDFSDEIKSKINIGLIADEVEKVMPECIGSIPNKKFKKIRSLDITPITYALINAVKELSRELEQLKKANV